MNDERIREIADAILYEGYLLYPYRHSSIKNRQRWTFGVVYPRSEAQGINEPSQMRTECLIAGSEETKLDITMRFLHLLKHTTEQEDRNAENGYRGHRGYETWEEGRAREVAGQDISLHEITKQAQRIAISFPEERLLEPVQHALSQTETPIHRAQARFMGRTTDQQPSQHPTSPHENIGQAESITKQTQETIRVQRAIEGVMTISAERVKEGVFKIAVLIENTSVIKSGDLARDEVLLHSFVSTHTLLKVQQGTFISLLEPPDEVANVAKACQNTHTWPVLIGHEGERNAMLSSPIILYDYPQIAPESIGTLFDGTEIDEILTLRIMTLTDEEKQEMRQADERVNALLDRTESLTADDLMSLHGVIRNLHSIDEEEVNR